MPVNQSAIYLTFASIQMAAEAMLDDSETFIERLTSGNDRSSRFTTIQAEQFAQEWQVVAHKPNTETGFSGTVFEYIGDTDASRGLTRGQLVMSFRSTEFADDAVRDNQATNTLEIKEFGWAFGQIADKPPSINFFR